MTEPANIHRTSGGSVTEALPKVSEREKLALNALAKIYNPHGEYCYLNFKTIARRSGLEPYLVRRTVRALARKGLAEYGKGLWTDEGELAGSGYCCTKAGYEVSQRAPK